MLELTVSLYGGGGGGKVIDLDFIVGHRILLFFLLYCVNDIYFWVNKIQYNTMRISIPIYDDFLCALITVYYNVVPTAQISMFTQ